MKLVTLNVEGTLHRQTVFPYLKSLEADVICLQEADESYKAFLEDLSYQTYFLPRCLKIQNGIEYIDGELLASRFPTAFSGFYYYKPSEVLMLENHKESTDKRTNRQGVVVGTIRSPKGEEYTIGTTHFTWTPEGAIANQAQINDMATFLNYVRTLGPHVMCGDFNIPRHHNRLYDDLMKLYLDTVPAQYTSSVDKTIHKRGDDPSKAHIFSDYMVDYIFTQPPFEASNVRLEFGLSDHAAVVAEISKLE
jgi:endonuclease/exonuclease/phosphatase family metal-dependent hydrolase